MKIANVAICALLAVALSASASDDIPRMADGKPDFSGTYDIASLTPFQRPEAHVESLYLPDDTVRELEQAALDVVIEGDAPSDPNRPPPEKGADVGFYNLAWLDMGDRLFKIDGRYRSSILVNPPDGRMPPLTEAGQARRDAAPELSNAHESYLFLDIDFNLDGAVDFNDCFDPMAVALGLPGCHLSG